MGALPGILLQLLQYIRKYGWLCGREPEGSSLLFFATGSEVQSSIIVLEPGS